MEFNLIDYKVFKIKYMLKFINLFFFFNSTRLKSRNWVFVEQALNSIKLSYYKVYNISTNKIINNSIFKNGNKLIVNGTTLFVTQNPKKANNKSFLSSTKTVNAHPLLIFLSAKINNKVYSSVQIEKINFSSYNKNLSIFCYSIKRNLKKQFIINFNTI
jgi:hypothetical protein